MSNQILVEVLQSWSPIVSVLISPLLVFMVERAKKANINKYTALAGASVVLGIGWTAFLQLPDHIVQEVIGFAITSGATASFIYTNFLKNGNKS